MGRLSASLLALALGAAAALALASCGGGDDAELLPGNTASEITANLDQVKQLADEGECVGAEDAAQEVSDQIEALGGRRPEAEAGAAAKAPTRLNEVVADCEEATEPKKNRAGSDPKRPKKPKPKKTKKREAGKGREGEAGKEDEEAEDEDRRPNRRRRRPKAKPKATKNGSTPPAEAEGGGTPSGGVGPGAPAEGGE